MRKEMKTYKIRWTVIESEIYEIEADSFEEACKILNEECNTPDEIVDVKMEEVEEDWLWHGSILVIQMEVILISVPQKRNLSN